MSAPRVRASFRDVTWRQAVVGYLTGLLVGILVLVAIQIADPALGVEDDSPPEDLEGPAADLWTAMTKTEETSHVRHLVQVEWNQETGSWNYNDTGQFPLYRIAAYDPSDRQILYRSDSSVIEGTDAWDEHYRGRYGNWDSYRSVDGAWFNTTEPWNYVDTYWGSERMEEFDQESLVHTTVTAETLSNGTVRYEVENGTLLFPHQHGYRVRSAASDEEPRVVFWVDGDTGLVERALAQSGPTDGQDSAGVRMTIANERFGEVDVERPDGVNKLEPEFLLWDLMRGPIVYNGY